MGGRCAGRAREFLRTRRRRAALAPAMVLCYKAAMNKALTRLLLTCLLAVALPLKGLAASSMLACGPGHHADAAAVAHAHDAVAPAHAHADEPATAATPSHGHDHPNGHDQRNGHNHPHGHDHQHEDGAAHAHAAGDATGSGSALSAIQPGGAAAADPAPDLKIKSKCGTCAPCCVSAALTGEQSLHIAQAATSADFPAFAAGHSSPPAGRLDRPPRSFLA